jgi:hypothetical protein
MFHGPFPLRLWRLLGGLACLALTVAIAAASLPETFSCGPPGADCYVKRGIRTPQRIERAAMTSVTVLDVRGNKSTYGIPVVRFAGGETRLRKGDGAAAHEFARAANDALSHDAAFKVSLDTPWVVFAFLAAFLAAGIGLFVTALRGLGRYRLLFDAEKQSLDVERRLAGFALSRSVVSTTNVVRVELEWSLQKDFFHHRRQRGDSVARLVLVAVDGESRPLTRRAYLGYTLHLRAAEELRVLLHCPPRSSVDIARHDALAQAFRPPPLAFRARLFFVWLGLCCGTFAGIALYIFFGTLLGHLKPDAPGMLWSAGAGALVGLIVALYVTRLRPPR